MTAAEHWVTDRKTWADSPEEDQIWSGSEWFRQPGDFAQINADFDARVEDPPPAYCVMNNGQALFYSGEVNNIYGDHSSGKTWLMLYTVKQAVEAGEKVLYLDFEDRARKAGYRLRYMGTGPKCIEENLMHVRPKGPYTAGEAEFLTTLVKLHRYGLVVIDTVGVALGVQGGDSNSDSDVAKWLDMLPNLVASLGPCVVMVDHGAVSAKDPSKPGGSGRKMQSISGSSFYVKNLDPFSIGNTGRSELTCYKDRNGNFQIGKPVGAFTLASSSKWHASVTLDAYNICTDPLAEGIAILDRLNASLDLTRDNAGALLRGAGWRGRNDVIPKILKARTDR